MGKMASFYQQFEICARKYSDNNSILFCDSDKIVHKINYKQLINEINRITSIFREHNVAKNVCIGIIIEPSPLLPAVILSIQKYECPFFCVDPKSTDIANIVANTGINYFLIDKSTQYFKNQAVFICRENELEFWKINNNHTIHKNISYIIQTSGTTGPNKIVKVQHNCIMSNINNLREIFEIKNTDVIYLGTPVTFDPFIVEIMLALTSGAALFIVDSKIKHNHKLLLQILFSENSGVTFLQMPPSVLLSFSEKDINKILCEKSSLRILALGGEKFPKELFKYKNWSNNLKVYNLYGITEVSCWASSTIVSEFDREVSLGKPLADTVFQIRDDLGSVVEKGEGNLFIGSDKRICLINNEDFTENSIIFRDTGDIVKLIDDEIFYVGRKNNIIKRLGHKINLSVIEESVYRITNLTSICVWDEKLILFVILHENDIIVKEKMIDRLRIKLVRNLPSIYIPDIINIIPSIPLTPNGKIDKNCLLQITHLDNKLNCDLSPAQIFQNLWSKYFGTSTHEINNQKFDSFLSLGGNSILAIQLISEFDSKISNSYSGNLMEMLLDPNKNYSDYLNLICSGKSQNLKRSYQPEFSKNKIKKLECHNENIFSNKNCLVV